MSRIDDFFAFANERQRIYLRRKLGKVRPWTNDPILSKHRFTNVYREQDRTTVWFRDKVREPLRSKPEVLLATVLFRWFNRITTGEALFCWPNIFTNQTAFENFLDDGEIAGLRETIIKHCNRGPYVTGAFIVNTPTGLSKLDGVLWAFGEFAKGPWRERTKWWVDHNSPLENAWTWFRQFPRIGEFQAYEFVTDLRHTDLLCRAPDIMTWANPGPGAKRGLAYIFGGDRWNMPPNLRSRGKQIETMRLLLEASKEYGWEGGDYPAWEMREVEHTLCEFAKYEMVRLGEGRTKGTYS